MAVALLLFPFFLFLVGEDLFSRGGEVLERQRWVGGLLATNENQGRQALDVCEVACSNGLNGAI